MSIDCGLIPQRNLVRMTKHLGRGTLYRMAYPKCRYLTVVAVPEIMGNPNAAWPISTPMSLTTASASSNNCAFLNESNLDEVAELRSSARTWNYASESHSKRSLPASLRISIAYATLNSREMPADSILRPGRSSNHDFTTPSSAESKCSHASVG